MASTDFHFQLYNFQNILSIVKNYILIYFMYLFVNIIYNLIKIISYLKLKYFNYNYL